MDEESARFTALCRGPHAQCLACGPENRCGLHLEFFLDREGSIKATFTCAEKYQGPEGDLHPGILATLVDSAMANCLFAHGVWGVTAELAVDFASPVLVGRPATIQARLDRSSPRLNLLRAEVIQDGEIKVSARGKFLNSPLFMAAPPSPDASAPPDPASVAP